MKQMKRQRLVVALLVGSGILAAALITALAPAPALAGEYSCSGKVTVGAEQSTIIDEINGSSEHICLFTTNSKAGRQILKRCPDGSQCVVELPLPAHGVPEERVTTIKPNTPVEVERSPDLVYCATTREMMTAAYAKGHCG